MCCAHALYHYTARKLEMQAFDDNLESPMIKDKGKDSD